MFDIVFLSYDEPNAEENWKRLKQRFPKAHRVHGIKGILKAHRECARVVNTESFFVVDGDYEILDDFKFEVPSNYLPDCNYTWRGINPVNNLVYGYGGVKLLPKAVFSKVELKGLDIMMNIGKQYIKVPCISSITRFNTSPFTAWRAGFRECVVLSSTTYTGLKEDACQYLLHVWCTVGADRPYGKWCIKGARDGRQYGTQNKNSREALNLIHDYDWLYEYFKRERDKLSSFS